MGPVTKSSVKHKDSNAKDNAYAGFSVNAWDSSCRAEATAAAMATAAVTEGRQWKRQQLKRTDANLSYC